MISFADAAAQFQQHYGRPPDALACAPGRLNLIGEHIDYAGGTVLPVAVQQGVTVAAACSTSGRFRLHSTAYETDGTEEFDAVSARPKSAAAVVSQLAERLGLHACDMLVCTDLPIGLGLSSSAALELASAGVLAAATGGEIPAVLTDSSEHPAVALCRIARQAEAIGLGVECGLMDQYASMYGRQGSALLIDTAVPSHEYLPLHLGGLNLMVIDSGQPRRLAESSYGLRRMEVETLLAQLGNLSPWDAETLRLAERGLPDPALSRRLAHITSEQQRVYKFAAALQAGDTHALGPLLTASHRSLSAHFEVSTPEIDLLIDLLLRYGAAGARIVGGGFGGAVLALVWDSALDRVGQALEDYRAQTGLEPSYLQCESGDGACAHFGGQTRLLRDWLGDADNI
jgi:galactokinase